MTVYTFKKISLDWLRASFLETSLIEADFISSIRLSNTIVDSTVIPKNNRKISLAIGIRIMGVLITKTFVISRDQ